MSIRNQIYNELFKVKIFYRNVKAIPVRKREAKKGIQLLYAVNSNTKRIYFCGVPMHKNLGDQGQRYCIEKWCETNYPEYSIVSLATWAFYENSFRKKLENIATEDDIFIIQSGYCTTSRHYDHPMHRYIVSTFKNNRILIMPQTVRFTSDRDGLKTGKLYNTHEGLMFLARDKVSYDIAKKYFTNTKVLLYPDIVTTLIGTMEFNGDREGVLLCIRNDGEKKYSSSQIEALGKRFIDNNVKCDITDTNSELPLGELVNHFEEELKKVLYKFSSYKVVITDRYHGTIFSMIANTPVIVLATRDHKVKTGTEWFNGVYDGAFQNADSIEDAFNLAEKILRSEIAIHNTAYYKEKYYDKLKDEFERETIDHGKAQKN